MVRAAAKKDKADVQYTPKAEMKTQRCELCRYFISSGRCHKVKGAISPKGWCRLFRRG